jgi:hypothetical protein
MRITVMGVMIVVGSVLLLAAVTYALLGNGTGQNGETR